MEHHNYIVRYIYIYIYIYKYTRTTIMLLSITKTILKARHNIALKPTIRLATARYHEAVVDHYENPRNVGSLDKNNKNVGTGLVGAPACGDVMKLQIEVDDEGRVVKSKFKTFGCGSAIASSSVATEWVKGKTMDECLAVTNKDIAALSELPPVKLHCSMLAEDAIKAAIHDIKDKQNA